MALKLKPLRKTRTEVIPPPKVGEIVRGKIVATGRSSVFLDLGTQGIGIIYGAEFHKARDFLKDLKINDTVSAKITALEDKEGYRELSPVEALKEAGWRGLSELKEKNEVLEVKVKKANKGGLISDINGIMAFLPASQLSPRHYPKVENGDSIKITQALQRFIGETLKVKIIDIEQKKEKLIISERAAEAKKSKSKESPKQYKVDSLVEGTIQGITNFGAFVVLPDKSEALLHSSEIGEEEKDKPRELKIGQKVKAKIIKIAEGRLYLSLNIGTESQSSNSK